LIQGAISRRKPIPTAGLAAQVNVRSVVTSRGFNKRYQASD
jgi:hypothetical protein